MNNIQNYGNVNVNSNYGKINKSPNLNFMGNKGDLLLKIFEENSGIINPQQLRAFFEKTHFNGEKDMVDLLESLNSYGRKAIKDTDDNINARINEVRNLLSSQNLTKYQLNFWTKLLCSYNRDLNKDIPRYLPKLTKNREAWLRMSYKDAEGNEIPRFRRYEIGTDFPDIKLTERGKKLANIFVGENRIEYRDGYRIVSNKYPRFEMHDIKALIDADVTVDNAFIEYAKTHTQMEAKDFIVRDKAIKMGRNDYFPPHYKAKPTDIAGYRCKPDFFCDTVTRIEYKLPN